MDDHQAARASRLRRLTETGPGTPMGTLLRQFWHPIAIANRLAPGTAQATRIMCEDLTLYRGQGGTPHLIGGRCAHRCTVLHTGWVEEDQIRCMYHGWRYDGTGRCTEMPAEASARAQHVRIAGYPLHEYSGLIFAFMGPGPAPEFELPRKDVLEDPAMDVSIREDVWDCNWLQQAENSLDATHVSFVHRWPTPTPLGAQIGATPPQLEYVETDAGIRQTAIRPNGVRISNWTFPNNNNVLAAPPQPGDPWINASGWAVPIDDESTLRFALTAYPGGEVGERLRRTGGISTGHVLDYAKVLFENHQLPDVGPGDRITAQDYAAVRGQGIVHDRSKERLGASDAGIALLRKIIFRELDAIRDGKPAKRWRKIDAPAVMQRLEPVS